MQEIRYSEMQTSLSLGLTMGPAAAARGNRCQILTKKGFLTARNLTSGVVLLLYSEKFQLGVLLHLGAVETATTSPKVLVNDEFSAPALSMLLSEFKSMGVRNKDLHVYVIGGSTDGEGPAFDVQVRRALWALELVPKACDLGGKLNRSVWMDVESGRVIVRSKTIVDVALESSEPISVAS